MNIKINKDIFREYDLRGVVGKDLDSEIVELIGKAYGTYLRSKSKVKSQKSKVIIGRDNRLSSSDYSRALIKGLTSVGCDVLDIGEVITPIFYYARILYGIDGGMMITASHNPKEYNGFKMTLGFGTIYGEEIQKVYQIARQGKFVSSNNGIVERKDPAPDYFKMLAEKIKPGQRKLKVVVDCGNGTTSLFASKILKNWGCEIIEIYCESDGNFPNHEPDPVKEEYIQDLKKKVLEEKADLGIGFDGDGDRLGVIDEKGNIIWGDMMMILFFKEILKKYPGMDCIIEVKCSQALYEMVEKFGGKPMFYKTGHSLIKAKMRELKTKFTGEMSGHMFFADEYYGFDDACYAAGRLLRILSNTNKNLSELFYDVPKYYSTPEVRVPVITDKIKFDIVREVVRDFKEKYQVEDIDGVRVMFSDGWALVRASNTQSVLVVRVEAKSKENLEKYKKIIQDKLFSFKEIENIDWSGKEG